MERAFTQERAADGHERGRRPGRGPRVAGRAKPIVERAVAVRGPGARAFPNLPEGTTTMPKIEHILVLMLENHSFDNVLGMLPHRVRSRRSVDGLPVNARGVVNAWNPDALGRRVYGTRFPSPCQLHSRPSQNWNESHTAYANGRIDGSVRASGRVAMRWYDEHGGYYDHVPAPRAIAPDSTPPRLAPGDVPGAYDRYGFRVPLLVASPWARKRYVSSVVQDHTSILRFIERKWNICALTLRDANAADMTDYFDFRSPGSAAPPALPGPPDIAAGLGLCKTQRLTPPLPA